MDITGRLVKKLALQTGSGANGNWQKQDFVIETEDQYPKKVCFSAWAARVDDLSRYNDGDRLKVHFDVASREYNERWYTDLRAWRIEPADAAAPAGGSFQQPSYPSAQAAAPSYSAPAQAPAAPAASSEGDDDLPF